jgi:hypothetical protein
MHLVPYLTELGVTECSCSPYLKANPGSRHGYDICEHASLKPDLRRRVVRDDRRSVEPADRVGVADLPVALLWAPDEQRRAG